MTKRSLNALNHGLYARQATLPWESSADYEAFYQGTRDELMPDGLLEEEAVREIADLQWRKRRLALSWWLQLQKQTPSPKLMEAAKGGLEKFIEYLSALENTQPTKLLMTTNELGKHLRNMEAISPAGESAADDKLKNLIQSQTSNPNAASDRDIIERAYNPSLLEQRLKLEAAIDGRITKALGRLVNLKEYKKIYTPKTLPPPESKSSPRVPAPPTTPSVVKPSTKAANKGADIPSNAAKVESKKVRNWLDPDD